MLIVPAEFNRNSRKVTDLMPPEDSGAWLLDRLRTRLGLTTLASTKLLDFGCGVRFAQAILNRGLSIGAYCGLDSFAPMISFLQNSVNDPRFTFHHFDAFHPMYSPRGAVLSPRTTLPVPAGHFDVASMFSVITHQYPPDARSLFHILKRHVTPRGHLFFTCFLDERLTTFEDRSPTRNGGFCVYSPAFMRDLVEECDWTIHSHQPPAGPIIADSFLLTPR